LDAVRRFGATSVPAFELRRSRSFRLTSGKLIFWGSFAFYLAVAFYFVFGAHIIMGDALSRVGSAERVFFSRDPHLAAIGFVWVPLPILAVLPLVPLKALWPELVTQGFASNIVSAAFMAGAVYLVRRILVEMGISRLVRWVLIGAFALHPLIVFSAGNGMSEAPFIFFVLLSAYYFRQWLLTGELSAQVVTGVALALAFLARYEGAIAGLSVVVVAGLVTLIRSKGSRTQRVMVALSDALIVGAPVALAVGLWTATSWLITGEALPNATSAYGTISQLRALGIPQGGLSIDGMLLVARAVTTLEPPWAIAIAVGLAIAVKRRDMAGLAILSVLGPTLAFMVWSYGTGALTHELRYLVTVVPLCILSLAVALRPRRLAQPTVASSGFVMTLRTGPGASALHFSVVLLILASIAGMFGALPSSYAALRGGSDYRQQAYGWAAERAIAARLDALELPRGSILIDSFLGFPIIQGSARPDQFVATSDRDFKQAVSDPSGLGVRYLMVPEGRSTGTLDALNRTYPGIYETGGGIGQLVEEFPIPDKLNWRLFRVVSN
jgi:hypothetical protein